MGKIAPGRTRTDLIKKEEGRGKKEEGRRKKIKRTAFLVSSFPPIPTNSPIPHYQFPNLKSKI
ncbi:MAG: hypothetical protein ABI262_16810 [Microcoleus sp.]